MGPSIRTGTERETDGQYTLTQRVRQGSEESFRGLQEFWRRGQRVDDREMLSKLDVCATRESRARLHNEMSRVSEWTPTGAVKWDGAAEEEDSQSQSPL